MKKDQVRFSQRVLSALLSVLLATQPLLPAVAATITPSGNTQMDKAANGVPVVNIATPNQSGISHNKYNDYNVGKEGLILNNATGQLNQTQLGGIIQNNPNLKAGQEAKGIINEVTGTQRSTLQGYTEVAGKAANVIVANPYGITCNGCGFINTPNATLTTGKPVLDAKGNLQSLDVSKGSITIEGQGLDGSQSDAVSIISRATEINARLHANDLTVIAGANRVAADGSVSALNAEGAVPNVAVDTGALGGMYANRIRLVSSEKGLGVNLGNLNARQGDIQLDAGGKLTVKNTLASGSITANGAGVALNGSHQAGGALNVASTQDLVLNQSTLVSSGEMRLSSQGNVRAEGGSLTSKGDLNVTAGKDVALVNTRAGSENRATISSNSLLSASSSEITAGKSLTLSAGQLALDGKSRADASGDIRLTAGQITSQGQLNAGNALTLSGGKVTNGGQLAAKGHLGINADALSNDGRVQGNDVSLQAQTVTNSGTLQSGGKLVLNADTLMQRGTLSAKGDASVVAGKTLQNTGSLLSDGALSVKAGTLVQDGKLSGATSLIVQADTLSSGKNALTTSQGNVQIAATQQADLNGLTEAAGALVISSQSLTTRQDAHLQSGKDLTLQADSAGLNGIQAAKGTLSVTANTLKHGGNSTGATLNVTAVDDVTNSGEFTADTLALSGRTITQSGAAKADRITLTAQASLSNSGTLIADSLSLSGASIVNSGLVQGSSLLDLKTGSLTNLAGGALYSARDLTLNIPTLDNSGLITTDGTLRLKGDTLTSRGEINGVSLDSDYASLSNLSGGRLLADDRLTLNGTTLVNEGDIAANRLNMAARSLHNQGTVQGEDALTLDVDDVTNSGALRTRGALDLHGVTLANRGELSATTLLLNLASQASNGADGQLIAHDGLTLTTAEMTNNGLVAGTDLHLNSAAVTNSGTLQGTRSLTTTGTRLTNQQAGMLLSGGALELHHTTLNNAGLLQGKTLNLATGEWVNTGNALGETGVTATMTGALTNSGTVLSQQTVDVQANSTDNRGQLLAKVLTLRGDLQNSGLLQGSSTLSWSGNTFVNQPQGQVNGGESLTLSGKNLTSQGNIQARNATLDAETLTNSGVLQTGDSLTLSTTGKLNNTGVILSQNLFTLMAAQLFNDGQLAAKALTLNAAQLTNNGTLQGNDSLALTTRALSNGNTGQLVSGSSLDLTLDTLDNAGLLLVDGGFTLRGTDLINHGDIQAQSLNLGLSNTLTNAGKTVATQNATLNAATLTNSGTVAANTLSLGGTELRNSGLMQGNNAIDATADRVINELNGTWLSGGTLTLKGGPLTNAGTLQGATLGMTGSTLTNSGTINGLSGLTGTFSGGLSNTGLLQSGGATTFSADTLANPGRIMGGTLLLNARDLNNSGLLQGANSLTLSGDTLTTNSASRTLSGGLLTLDAGQLATQGTLQGNGVNISASGWTHGGSLLSQGALTADTSGTLTSTGSLMSQDAADITAQMLDNRGQLLSEDNVTLSGSTLKNSGAVQGKTLALRQNSINNQGTLTGLQSLTVQGQQRLMARMAMAAPQQELINGAGGKLLTQGTLNITSGAVTNAGSWQAQNILLNAQSLTNSGAVQSADALQMTLADTLNSTAGSKITALGTAALRATALTNQGQWAAKNLTLTSGTLSNSGAISGVNGLTLSQTGAISQQANGTMLTGGALNLNAASLTSSGKIQGGTLGITTGALTNSGRLQGDNGASLTLSGTLTNNTGGEIVSRNGLTITTPVLLNYGLIQGGGDTRVTASSQVRNDGKLLSGAGLTLGAPQYGGTGWLQATDLILNAATATHSGTWIADRATLTGNTFTSQGTTQAGQLTVNYSQLNNSGTLLGNTQLNIDADRVTQSTGGKLLSGGDLWLQSKGLDIVGQLVSLGNLTLQLTNAFTSQTAVAAGKTLTINSNGAIDNRSVMQGQAVNLNAGGQLSNNGQITTGTGASTLSGSSVALNAAGSVQGGGDITVASRGNITVDGFTGTRGSLTLSAPGSIVNTALLYAANNLALYADSITNQRGDIMAGNNLWMQKDAAGNANSQVVNTSGNIETQSGDITVKTAYLRNEAEGLVVNQHEQQYPDAIPKQSPYLYGSYYGKQIPDIEISLEEWKHNGTNVVFDEYEECRGSGANGSGQCSREIVYRLLGEDIRQFILSESVVEASATGGAARIAAGRDITVNAGTLDNRASNILAGRNISLSGGTLNNFSAEAGRRITYVQAEYHCEWFFSDCADPKWTPLSSYGEGKWYWWDDDQRKYRSWVPYKLGEQKTEYTVESSAYRAVIQAGGNVNANFTSNISNTNTTANAGGVSNVIATPSLNTLSNQTIDSGVQKQNLVKTGTVAVNTPQWNDQLQDALQQLNGGGALDTSGAANASLSTISTAQKGDASLGKLGDLAKAGATTADLRTAESGPFGQHQGQRVDTSAYPLPSGNNGYFVFSENPKSPYLINVNPKLNTLGQLDPALFAELNAMLGLKPSSNAPQETRTAFTDEKQFLGSSYMLDRLNLNPDYDYRFLGDAAFDTRYVSNVVLNQTGNRYLNGMGSDLDQMRYLMDNAASAQQSLGLQFGVSLTAAQIAALDHSMVWWEKATINGETVMVPKLYLSPKDVTVNNGSVIAGNNVSLKSGEITNNGSSLLANNTLTLDSQNSISNLNSGLMKAGGDLNLSAIGDINNISSTISGKTVALESLDGSINNLTQVEQIDINAKSKYGNISLKDTLLGNTASITAQDGLSLEAGKNITVTGANLASGGDMLLNAWGDIAVNANQINDAFSSSKGKTGRSSVTYQGSSVSAGGNLVANAGHNIDLTASDLKAGGSAGLSAGNDLNLNAEQTRESSRKGKSEAHSTGLDRTTISAGDSLALKAGQDINAQAAALAAEKNVGLQAGRDVNLAAESTTQGDSYKASKKTVINESVRQQGTEIASGGDTHIIAGRDVTTEAAQVTAKGDIGVLAGRDVNLNTATESDYYYKEQTKTKSGFLSKKTTHTIEENSATREAGSLLSGDNVSVSAGNNLLVKGSAVAGDGDVQLKAGNNVDIVAATNSDTSWRFKEEKKSGLMGTGGIGFTIGSSKSTHDLREKGTTQSQSFSTVGSTGGDVSITAGKQAHIGGADVVAKQDIAVTGDSVVIEPGHDKRTRDEKFEQKSSGLTVALSGMAGSAVNSAISTAQSAKESSDSRLAALQGTQAVLSGVQAGQAVALDQAKGASDENNNNTLGVSASLGTQSSTSSSHMQSETTKGSTLNAGNNVTINATGSDITVAGSQIKAGKDVTLDAARDVNLIASQDTQQTTGKNSSSGGSIGAGVGVGSGGVGISISANANSSRGHEKGNGVWQNETTVDAGNQVAINSGRDTTLAGAQVSGNQVTAEVGRDLTITSTQDSDHYNSRQNSISGGVGYTLGAGSFSGSLSLSRDKMTSDYDSVQEQSGIFAGHGGFDVTVGNHTQLDGGAIASTATADKNRLDTGTLGFSDIRNQADFKTEHQGAGISSGGSIGGQFAGNMANGLLAGGGNSGHAEGTTQAAVSDGSLIIRDKDNQKQDVAALSRDTEHANGSISPIFDKEKEQKRLQEVQLIGALGSQAADVARTQGEINALTEARKAHPEMSASDLPNTPEYKAEQAKSGTGSDLQRGIQAATAALQGLAGSDIAGALAGASAPELANYIGHGSGLSDEAAVVAHAILGGAVAALQGNSAVAGAAGAATGELAAKAIAGMLYPDVKDLSALSEEQKQTVSTLATIAAGMAGGIAGDSTGSAVAGGQAGKNAVENNSLSDIAQAQSEGKTLEQKASEYVKAENERYKKANCGGMSAEACSVKMYEERREALKSTASFGADFMPVLGDIKSFAEADSALGYLAAVVGILPGLGDAAGKALKGAEKALKAGDLETASKLINKASDEIQSVKALDVGSYKDLKKGEVVGDGLEHDHIPSFAALKKAKEAEFGRPLTDAETKNLYQNATAVEVPKDAHQAGPTYGGKNTTAQVQQDAINLCGAVCRDTDALKNNMIERGYDPKQVEDAIKQIIDRNRQAGVIK